MNDGSRPKAGIDRGAAIRDERSFQELIRRNPINRAILSRLESLNVPDAWLVSGCLFQTVWNVLGNHEPVRGIRDYDVFYFDDSDTSPEAEEQINQQAATLFSDQHCMIDIRNQARVHEWYFDEFGVEGYPRLKKSSDGIDNFLSTCCMVAVRPSDESGYELYAPFGVQDIFDRVVRPNPWFPNAPRDSYVKKAERWRELWPEITVLPFAEAAPQ